MLRVCRPSSLSILSWNSCLRFTAVGAVNNHATRSVSTSSSSDQIAATATATNGEIHNTSVNAKPMSELPSNGKHWAMNVLEIFTRKGGFNKAFYGIQEDAVKYVVLNFCDDSFSWIFLKEMKYLNRIAWLSTLKLLHTKSNRSYIIALKIYYLETQKPREQRASSLETVAYTYRI